MNEDDSAVRENYGDVGRRDLSFNLIGIGLNVIAAIPRTIIT